MLGSLGRVKNPVHSSTQVEVLSSSGDFSRNKYGFTRTPQPSWFFLDRPGDQKRFVPEPNDPKGAATSPKRETAAMAVVEREQPRGKLPKIPKVASPGRPPAEANELAFIDELLERCYANVPQRTKVATVPLAAVDVTLAPGYHPRTNPVERKSRELRAMPQQEDVMTEIIPLLHEMTNALKEARATRKQKQDRCKGYADRRRCSGPTYQPGNLVWVNTHALSATERGFTAQLAPRRDGPYRVPRQAGATRYKVAKQEEPTVPLGTYHTSVLTLDEGQPEVATAKTIPKWV